jgi:hypothetical protein
VGKMFSKTLVILFLKYHVACPTGADPRHFPGFQFPQSYPEERTMKKIIITISIDSLLKKK